MPFTGQGTGIQNANDVFFSGLGSDQVLKYNNSTSKWNNIPAEIPFATISLPGTLSTGTIELPFPVVGTWHFSALVANVGTASSGSSIIVDLMYNGTSIFSSSPANRPTIAAGALWDAAGTPTTTQYSGSTSVRGYLTFAVTQVGSVGNEGADLVATLYAARVS